MKSDNDLLEELAAAFKKSQPYIDSEILKDPLHGFGAGYKLGKIVLEKFMPDWFQQWFNSKNWHPVGLLEGEHSWWIYVKAFGLSKEEWLKQVKQFIK